MKKKLLTVTVGVCLMLALAGCGAKETATVGSESKADKIEAGTAVGEIASGAVDAAIDATEVTTEYGTEETTEVVEETATEETVTEETTETVEETTEEIAEEVTGEEADFPKVFTDDDPRTNAMTDIYAAYGETFDSSKGKLYCWNIEGTPLVRITAGTELYDTVKQLMSDDNNEISSFATVSTVDGEKEVLLLATEEVTVYAYTLGGYMIEIEEQAKVINSVEDLQHYVDLIRFE